MFKPLFLSSLFLFSCVQTEKIREIFSFPKSLKENSGIEITAKSNLIWTIQDSGNPAEIYGLDTNGKIVQRIALTNAPNNDWEDLTSDEQGNLYIGDFGNNDNKRRDLAIYKVDAAQLRNATAKASSKISFYFPQQKVFPPKKSELVYDVEAFFIWQQHFYLFTKNRSANFNGETTLYEIPNRPGNHAAKKIGSFKTCASFGHCAITSADRSPDGTKVALLTGSSVWLFTGFKGNDFFAGKVQQIELGHYSQKEGLCFSGNKKLLISDEKKKKTGGNLYELALD